MSNVLRTTFLCNGSPCDVATTRNAGETLADLADRHDAEVAEAKDDCTSVGATLGPIQTDWRSGSGDDIVSILYASPAAYGQAAHDADVTSLQNIYPPAAA